MASWLIMMIKISIYDTRLNCGKSQVFEILVKIEQRSINLWTILCLTNHQKNRQLNQRNSTTYRKLKKFFKINFQIKSTFELVCRIGDRILQAKQRHWSWKRAKIFATFNLRDPKSAKNIIIDSDERVNRLLPKNPVFLPYESFLTGNEMKLLIKYQGFVNLSKGKKRPGTFDIQEIRSSKKGWCHIGCLGENFPSDTPSEIRYMLMCITCRLKMSTGTDNHHLQLGLAEHITFVRDLNKFLPPCSMGSLQFLVKRQIGEYDGRIMGKIHRLTDKVIEALASGIVKRGKIRNEDPTYIDMLEKIGRQISARTALAQVWLPIPVTPTLVSQPPTWDVGTSSTSDISFSASDCSLNEIFPSPEYSPKIFNSDTSDSEEPFFLAGRTTAAKKSKEKKEKGQKRRRSVSDPGLTTKGKKTKIQVKDEPPTLTELPKPLISEVILEEETNSGGHSKTVKSKKPKGTIHKKGVSRKSFEKKAEATHSEFATLRSALSASRKREWTLDEVLILKGEAQEIVKAKARVALDTARPSEHKALNVLLAFD